MRRSSRFGWLDRSAAGLLGMAFIVCLLALGLLVSCAGADDSDQPQSHNAHLHGSYVAGAILTSVP
jgi:hypothetical protein